MSLVTCPCCESVIRLEPVTMTKPTEPWRPPADPLPARPKRSAREAVAEVCEQTGVSFEQMRGRSRERRIIFARQEAMAAASLAGASLREIAEIFDRDHSTVHNALSRHQQELAA